MPYRTGGRRLHQWREANVAWKAQHTAHHRYRAPEASRPTRPEKTHRLLADVETPNNVEVTLRGNLLEIVQQAPPATDQHQQPSPTGEVLLVRPKVLGQPVDPGRENGDLDLGRAGILPAAPKLPNQLLLPLSGNGHLLPRLIHLGRPYITLPKHDPPTMFTRTLPT
jgi:hypothetical protein